MKLLRSNSVIAGCCRFALALSIVVLGGCATQPPGAGFPKTASYALAHPEVTRLGREFGAAAAGHGGHSGFRIIPAGIDGFLLRMQMINAAEKTLDLQYFIFRGDETGRLLSDAVLHAADRGVRVRVLVDDADTLPGDEQIAALEAHPNIDIRIFNPFAYRGHVTLVRAFEFTFNAPRLNYRMHNKLLVVDNAVALVGGRNIGDEYFQVDPNAQFGDDDVFAGGPVAMALSASFDDYWNSDLAIPIRALTGKTPTPAQLNAHREVLDGRRQVLNADGVDYVTRVASGEPFKGVLAGRTPLVWAPAQVVGDSPDKRKVESGAEAGQSIRRSVADAAGAVQSELLMITPFLVPGNEGMRLIEDLRQRKVRVGILTNSLESSMELAAQAGYMHYRKRFLETGVELYEVRSRLGNSRGSGEPAAVARFGSFSLHAKLYVFDRTRVFVGSMNFDQRSMHLNTEVGLIIDSPELAKQVAARFDAMTQPANCYRLALLADREGGPSRIVWHTQEGSEPVEYDTEPARDGWQRIEAHLLSLMPWDREL